jgi:hypothetical protein
MQVFLYLLVHRNCKKLGLNPPVPIIYSEALKWYKYISYKSKEERYKEFKIWIYTQWFLYIAFGICFYMGILSQLK